MEGKRGREGEREGQEKGQRKERGRGGSWQGKRAMQTAMAKVWKELRKRGGKGNRLRKNRFWRSSASGRQRGRGLLPGGSPSGRFTVLLGICLPPPGPRTSISCHVSLARLPLSTRGPGEHMRLGSVGPKVCAHLISPEDGQRLSHGLSVRQDEVQHPVSIEVCHHTPCNNADCTLAIGQEPHRGGGSRPVPCPQCLVGEVLGQQGWGWMPVSSPF